MNNLITMPNHIFLLCFCGHTEENIWIPRGRNANPKNINMKGKWEVVQQIETHSRRGLFNVPVTEEVAWLCPVYFLNYLCGYLNSELWGYICALYSSAAEGQFHDSCCRAIKERRMDTDHRRNREDTALDDIEVSNTDWQALCLFYCNSSLQQKCQPTTKHLALFVFKW